MKFKKGDKVKNKRTGAIDTVKSVPGMQEYDSRCYSSADKGFVLERNGWEHQEHWELVEPKFKVGDRVKLKEYTYHSDWERHYGNIGTIDGLNQGCKVIGHPKFGQMKYGFHIKWDDCSSSNAPEENLELVASKPEIQTCVEPEVHELYGVRFIETPKKKGVIPMLSQLAKKLFSPDVKALVEVGWLDSELEVTDEGKDAIFALFVEEHQKELADRARKQLAEQKKK